MSRRRAMHSTRRLQSGFTLIEVLIVIAILGVLASIALASYQRYVLAAKLTEAYTLLGALQTEVQVGFHASSGAYPLRAGASQARIPQANGRSRRAPAAQRWVDMPDSELIRRYRYEVRPNARRAWVQVQLQRREIDGCGGQCSIFYGFQQTRSGDLRKFCGTWTSGRNARFPLDLMPAGCTSTCVRCDLNSVRNL